MSTEDLKNTAKHLLSLPGNVKGEVIITNLRYIRSQEGLQGMEKLQDKMYELGADINFEDIKPFKWYSEGFNSLVVVAAKEIFGWTDDDIFEMGHSTLKLSFLAKLIMQYFVSVRRVFDNASKYWEKHFDIGKIELVEFDEGKGRAVLRIKEFVMHPVNCTYQRGYFKSITELLVKTKEVRVEETKCVHNGDDYHEFLISWK